VDNEEDTWSLRDKLTGWRKLHNEELHTLYSPGSVIRLVT